MQKLAKGHRSIVYLVNYNGKKAAKKIERADIYAVNRIKNESEWLRKLNKYKIAPKLYFSEDNYLICEYVSGKRITDFLKSSKNPYLVIILILKQCRTLDKLNIDKKEMSNPYKHIIIRKNKPVMIDFERSRFSLRPQNVTAFFTFLTSKKIKDILIKKGVIVYRESLIDLLKKYKRTYSEEDFEKLIKMIKTP